MKHKLVLLALFATCLSFTACEEDKDSYDFSESMPAYVEIKSKTALTVEEGATATVTFQSREAFQQAKTLTYEIAGAYNATGTVVLPRNTLSTALTFTVPTGVVPAGSETAVASLSLTDADGLSVGRKGADKEVVTINITKK